MASSDATDAAVRVLLQKTAHLHYSRLAAHAKEAIRAGFFGLDESQDGRISLREFMQVGAALHADQDPQAALVPKLFRFLDADNSGFLEFDEYITLHYLLDAGLLLCESCDAPIMMLGYTCKTCWEQRSDTFDICLNCYASRSFSHIHDAFVDNTTMFNLLMLADPPSTPAQVQCGVCGDFHNKEIRGALIAGQKHVREAEGESNEFVCEWCSSWLCNNCGEFFQGATSTSAPNKWLRTNLCCSSCRVHGSTTNLSSVFKVLDNTEPGKNCSSCAIKIRRGLLWATYKGSMNNSSNVQDELSARHKLGSRHAR